MDPYKGVLAAFISGVCVEAIPSPLFLVTSISNLQPCYFSKMTLQSVLWNGMFVMKAYMVVKHNLRNSSLGSVLLKSALNKSTLTSNWSTFDWASARIFKSSHMVWMRVCRELLSFSNSSTFRCNALSNSFFSFSSAVALQSLSLMSSQSCDDVRQTCYGWLTSLLLLITCLRSCTSYQ